MRTVRSSPAVSSACPGSRSASAAAHSTATTSAPAHAPTRMQHAAPAHTASAAGTSRSSPTVYNTTWARIASSFAGPMPLTSSSPSTDRNGPFASRCATIAAAVAGHARPQDLVARFGGEEFCMLVPGLPEDAAYGYFEALRQRIAGLRIPVGAEELRVTVSIGVTMVSADDSLSRLIAEADRCLYLAKAAGRDRVQPSWATVASVA